MIHYKGLMSARPRNLALQGWGFSRTPHAHALHALARPKVQVQAIKQLQPDDEPRLQGVLQSYWVDEPHAPVKRMAVMLQLGFGANKSSKSHEVLTGGVLGSNVCEPLTGKLKSIFKGTDGQFEVIRTRPDFALRLHSSFRAELIAAVKQQQQQQQQEQISKRAADNLPEWGEEPASDTQQTISFAALRSSFPVAAAPRTQIVSRCGSTEHLQMLHHLTFCTQVAVDCEWCVAQGGQLCLVQIFAPRVLETSNSSSSSSSSSGGDGGSSGSGSSNTSNSTSSGSGVSSTSSNSGSGGGGNVMQATVYLVDPIAAAKHEVAGGINLIQSLTPMLTAPTILKVFHDCRKDTSCLRQACGSFVAPVLDTQIAYALSQLSVLTLKGSSAASSAAPSGMPEDDGCLGQRVGLAHLLDTCGFSESAQLKRAWANKQKGDSVWMERPMSQDAIAYATGDVVHLLDIAKHLNSLDSRLALALSQFQADLQQAEVQEPNVLHPAWLSVLREYFRAGKQIGSLGQAQPFPPDTVPVFKMEFGENGAPEYSIFMPGLDENGQFKGAATKDKEAGKDSKNQGSSKAEMEVVDEDVATIVDVLPPQLQTEVISRLGPDKQLMEIAVDEGRFVQLRFKGHVPQKLPIKVSVAEAISLLVLARQGHTNMAAVQARSPFGSDGRMGIPGTLHRISGMRNKEGEVHALTYRIGRHIPGVARIFTDLLSPRDTTAGDSILIVGRPGAGKTTLLRDITRILADVMHQAVIVVDTSNEVAGDADDVHPCIGCARRFMVPHRDLQHDVLVEAVQNHCPDVLVVDEIGTRKEVQAAMTISQRGVRMVATAHGNDIHSLVQNPELLPLLGGVESVTLGDDEAKRSNNGEKIKLRRRGTPFFNILIEVHNNRRWVIHRSIASSMDQLLSFQSTQPTTQRHSQISFHKQQCQQLDTEQRYYGGENGQSMLVTFSTLRAAETALASLRQKEGAAVPGRGLVGNRQPHTSGLEGSWLSDLLQEVVWKAHQAK